MNVKALSLFLLSPIVLGAYEGVEGSGVSKSETRKLSAFERIDVSGAFEIEVIPADEYRVELSADDNLLSFIETRVDGDRLILKTKNYSLRSKSKMLAKIYTPKLTKADLSGAVKGKIQIPQKTESFAVDASGATKLELVGKVSKLDLELSGASKLNGLELWAQDVNIDASGATKIKIRVEGKLNVEASGAAKIRYAGQPSQINQDTSGAVSIKRI